MIRHGIQARAFASPVEFPGDPQAFDFDFYSVDLGMPLPDGYQLIRLLRKRTQVGILVLTASSQHGAFDDAMNAGADLFLAKPVRFGARGRAGTLKYSRPAPCTNMTRMSGAYKAVAKAA